jgi:seryl-tRNA synthetase
MLQVSVLKAAPEKVKQQLAKKHFKQPELVDAIIQTDDERKKVQAAFDDTQAKVNAASKEIGSING